MFYNRKKLKLAFEYGLIIADVAKQRDIVLTKEIIERAEDILAKEFTFKSPTKLSTEMIPNLLAMLEPKDL